MAPNISADVCVPPDPKLVLLSFDDVPPVQVDPLYNSVAPVLEGGGAPPKARAAVFESPTPPIEPLEVFILPPVTQAPTAMFAFHSSVAAVADGVLPPNTTPVVCVPPPPRPALAVFN